MRIDALILDYGGVVIHEDPADYDPIAVPNDFAPGELWTLVHTIPEYAPSRIGAIPQERFHAAVAAAIASRCGVASASTIMAALADYYARHAAPRPAMCELLDALAGRVKRVLLSNASRGSTARFAERLQGRFDAIVCSGDVGVAKPDAAAYRLAAARGGARPERCAFVDDVAANVAAARAVGMQGLHYHHSRHVELIDALSGWGLAVD